MVKETFNGHVHKCIASVLFTLTLYKQKMYKKNMFFFPYKAQLFCVIKLNDVETESWK